MMTARCMITWCLRNLKNSLEPACMYIYMCHVLFCMIHVIVGVCVLVLYYCECIYYMCIIAIYCESVCFSIVVLLFIVNVSNFGYNNV